MPPVILRAVFRGIDERGDKAAAIGNHQLQRRRRGTLVMASTVIGVPDQHAGNAGIHPSSHEEGHTVFDFRVVDADVGDHGVADDGGDENEEHDHAAQLEAIRDEGDGDCEYGGNSVWYYGPQLSFVGGVSKLYDDRWELCLGLDERQRKVGLSGWVTDEEPEGVKTC